MFSFKVYVIVIIIIIVVIVVIIVVIIKDFMVEAFGLFRLQVYNWLVHLFVGHPVLLLVGL
jgi:hypothetical protein